MKPIHGLILAVGLGLGAALFNFAYLNMKSRDVEKVDFLGIKPGVTVGRGEVLTDAHLVKVGIPARWIGSLKEFAELDSARSSVVGEPVWHTISGGTLLLREDLKTPPPELTLGEDEAAVGVPVDVRTFPPSLIVPGDLVSFIVSKTPTNAPTRAERPETTDFGQPPDADVEPPLEPDKPTEPSGPTETLGKFKVLSLGNRLGDAEVMKAARIPQRQENVMTISVKVTADGKLVEKKAQKLVDLLHTTNFQKVGILLHTRERKGNN